MTMPPNDMNNQPSTSKTRNLKHPSKSRKCAICDAIPNDYPDRRFHGFPKYCELSNKWAEVVGKKWILHHTPIQRASRFVICSSHFEATDYFSASKLRLKPTAVPKYYNKASIQQNRAMIANLKNKLALKLNPNQNTEFPSGKTSAISSSLYGSQNTMMFETSRDETSAIASSLYSSENAKNFEIFEGETSVISSPLYSTQNTMMFETSEGKDKSSSSNVILNSKDLFLNQQYCDVFIRVKELEFPAHRAILSASSPVFETMCDVKEKGNDIIYIEDCDASAFLNFLCFVYCGETESTCEKNVFELFAIADKYDVQDLRTKCVKFIKENLSFDTFCDTLTIALQHSETELIQLATEFFRKNLQKIIVTDKWQSLLVKHPIQCNELLIKALIPNNTPNV